jgi:hypothetical protein
MGEHQEGAAAGEDGPLRCVVYVSSAVELFTTDELEALLRDARTFNERAGVTGVLLYQDGSFFQYIEGPPDGVQAVYDRVRAATRHTHLIELQDAPIHRRHFEAWLMGFAEPQPSEFLAIAQADWLARSAAGLTEPDGNQGLRLLAAFWQRARR